LKASLKKLPPRSCKRLNAMTKVRRIVEAAYDNVHAALWATLCIFLLYAIVFIVPSIPAARTRMKLQRLSEIAAENRFYCEKWGMPVGTHRHVLCTLDLQTIRANVERRIDPDNF
jgi:hypothetical protein